MKKNILFVFVSDIYIRNFIKNNIISDLKKKFNVKYIIEKPKIIKYKKYLKNKDCIGTFTYSRQQIKDFNLLNISHRISNENLSKSFKFQNKTSFLNVVFRRLNENIYKSILYLILRILIKIYRLLNYYFFYRIKNIRKFLLKKYLTKYIKKPLSSLVQKYNPDLVIFPSQGNHPGMFEIKNNCRNKVFLLCDNWDNPSSKSYLDPKPDIVSVWGKQSRKHAIKCNNFNSKNVKILGTPKYQIFYKLKNLKLKSYFNFEYILVLESWVNDGIYETLKILNEMVSKNLYLKNKKILFRPHPHPTYPKIYNLKNLKNVIFDPNVKSNHKNSKFDSGALTEINYYPSLINNASLIISGPTTMILESCMFYKKTILLAFDGKSYFNHKNTFENMIHLFGVDRFPNVVINKNLNNLEGDITKLIKKKITKSQKNEINNCMNYFLTNK